jgi:hypothetical protein
MAEDYAPTVRIRRAKVTTDERGRTVWAETVETVQLELVSTGSLQKILASSDDDTRSAIERLVTQNQEGVLARDPETGLYEIISDADLREILQDDDSFPAPSPAAKVTLEPVDPDEELSLVSTQVLRKILRQETPQGGRMKALRTKKDEGGGFDPYDSG